MRFFEKKIIRGIFAAIAMLAFIGAGAFYLAKRIERQAMPTARAGTADNLHGFAWSDNFGWVSFNSTDCDTDGDGSFEGPTEGVQPVPTGCPTVGEAYDYGVNVDANSLFSGFAWSNTVGWIAFESVKSCSNDLARLCNIDSDCLGVATCGYPAPPVNADADPCPDANCNDSSKCTACMDSGQAKGWARVLSLGENGWLSLSGEDGSGGQYGVRFDISKAAIMGFAWNGNDDPSAGLGWLSFNSLDCDPDNDGTVEAASCPVGTSTAPYSVKTGMSGASFKMYVSEFPTDRCHGFSISWDPVPGVSSFSVYSDNNSDVTLSDTFECTGAASCVTSSIINPGTERWFAVFASDSFGMVKASNAALASTTYSVCEIDAGSASAMGTCPGSVAVDWDAPDASATLCTIDHYEVARCECLGLPGDICGNCDDNIEDSESLPADYRLIPIGDCLNPRNDSCVDDSLTLAEKDDRFQYSARAVCAGLDSGKWSEQFPESVGPGLDGLVPCPQRPFWLENKAR
jgi:hypothetical protein